MWSKWSEQAAGVCSANFDYQHDNNSQNLPDAHILVGSFRSIDQITHTIFYHLFYHLNYHFMTRIRFYQAT
jgi:hypothetical protein